MNPHKPSDLGASGGIPGLTTSRIEAFSDGVFAIVITLLIFNVKIPEMAKAASDRELWSALAELFPKFESFVMSFVVVGIYWVGHHLMFHNIRRSDRVLLWLNILFLMFVCFLPFPTALLGAYPRHRPAIALYGASLTVTGLALYVIWWYATSGGRLVDTDLSPAFVRTVGRRILVAPVAFLFSIALSSISITASLVLYVLVAVFYILPGRVEHYWKRAP